MAVDTEVTMSHFSVAMGVAGLKTGMVHSGAAACAGTTVVAGSVLTAEAGANVVVVSWETGMAVVGVSTKMVMSAGSAAGWEAVKTGPCVAFDVSVAGQDMNTMWGVIEFRSRHGSRSHSWCRCGNGIGVWVWKRRYCRSQKACRPPTLGGEHEHARCKVPFLLNKCTLAKTAEA